MGKLQAVVNLVKVATQANPTARVGANMAQKVGRLSLVKRTQCWTTKEFLNFNGTKQVLNGQTIVQGKSTRFSVGRYDDKFDLDDKYIMSERYFTKILQKTENGTKSVSRIIPNRADNFTARFDLTKVTNTSSAQVGALKVNTFNQVSYTYGNNGLDINERTIDRVFAGKRHLGGRAIIRDIDEYSTRAQSGYSKVFFGPNGMPLKTVHVNAKGIRTHAELPDGRIIRYDAKGLPIATSAETGKALNLGGLDKLI